MTKNNETYKYFVAYTDGGHRGNDLGIGIHGYFHNGDPAVKGSGCKAPLLTDRYGLVGPKTDAAEVDVCAYLDYIEPVYGINETNNRCEANAVDRVLSFALTHKVSHVYIYSDSDITVKGINVWSKNWVKKDWHRSNGKPVENSDIFKRILTTLAVLRDSGVSVTIEHVKAHTTGANFNVGNNTADYLATSALHVANHYKSENVSLDDTPGLSITYSDPKGYWRQTKEIQRWYDKPYLYYFSNVSTNNDKRHVYFTGRHDDHHLVAKNTSDSSYGVVVKRDVDPVFDRLFKYIDDITPDTHLYIISIDVYGKTNVYNLFDEEGIAPCVLKKHHIDGSISVHAPDNSIIAVRPVAALAFRLDEHLQHIMSVYDAYETDHDDTSVCVTDITNTFYTNDVNKKGEDIVLFNKSITSSVKFVDVMVDYFLSDKPIKLRLTFDLSLPTRNMMAGLAVNDIRVEVVTVPCGVGFRYYTVISDGETDTIWSAVAANIKPVTTK